MRSYFLINLILLGLIGFLGYELHASITAQYVLPAKPVQKQQSAAKTGDQGVPVVNPPKDAAAYQIIVQQDLFRQSRKEPQKESLQAQASLPPPKLIGTISSPRGVKAYFEEPQAKVPRAYGINESIGGFLIKEIGNNKVVLLRGDQKVVVDLSDVRTVNKPVPRHAASPGVPMPSAAVPMIPAAPSMQPPSPPPPLPPPPPAYVPPRRGAGVPRGVPGA